MFSSISCRAVCANSIRVAVVSVSHLSKTSGLLGLADIALREIIEEKIGWTLPEQKAAVRPIAKKRKKH